MAIEKRVELADGTPAVPVPMRAYPSVAASIGLLAARVPIGAFLMIAGIRKFRSPGVGAFVDSQLSKATAYMPEHLGRMYLNAVPYAEVTLGLLLVIGLLTRFAGLIVTLMLISFTVAVTGIRHEQFPFSPNVIYIGLTLAILFCAPGRFSVDGFLFRPRRKVTITEQYTERLA